MDEAELLRACLRGDEGAWHEFLNRYVTFVCNFAASRLRLYTRDEAERDAIDDVTSDVFLSLIVNDFQALRRISDKGSIKSWLAVIADSRVKDYIRAGARHVKLRERLQESTETAESMLSDMAVLDEDTGRLEMVLDSLSKQDRMIMDLHYREGLSLEKIAHWVRMTPGGVRKAHTRILGHLRGLLEKN